MNDILNALSGVAVLLASAKVFGALARRLRIPPIVAELLVGLVLGPTVLGPFAFATSPIFQTIVQGALLFFLLSTGGHLDLRASRLYAGQSATIALGGIVAPFTLALIAVGGAPWIFAGIAGPAAHSELQITLFFGLALSISAVPVIAKILMDLDMYRSRVGNVVMTTALLTDLAAWILFALIGGAGGRHGGATLGAFLVGAALSPTPIVKTQAFKKILRFNANWLAPIFFASIGLRANFIENFDPQLVIAVICLACVGKLLGCGLAGRLAGLHKSEAWAVAFGLNARGAMEIVLCLTALNEQLITVRFFEALVIMAFVTALISGPMIQYFLVTTRGKVPA